MYLQFFAVLETEASRLLRSIPGAIRVDLILRNAKEAVPLGASSEIAPSLRRRLTRPAGRDRRVVHAVL